METQIPGLGPEYDDIQLQSPIPMATPQVPSEILKIELDFDTSLKALERKLKGHTKQIEGKQEIWKKTGTAWMNDDGIHRIIAIIRSHMDTNTIMSNLTDTEINIIMLELSNEMTTVLSNKCSDFDIEATYLGSIFLIVINTIYFALKRAQGAMTLKQIHSMTSRIENPAVADKLRDKEKGGFLRRFL